MTNDSDDDAPEQETFASGSHKEKERQKLVNQVFAVISKKKKQRNQDRDQAFKARALEHKKNATANDSQASESHHLDPSIFSAAAAASTSIPSNPSKKRKRTSSDSRAAKKRRAGKPRVTPNGEVIGNTTIRRLTTDADGSGVTPVSPASRLLVRRALFKKKPLDMQLRGRSTSRESVKAGLQLKNMDGIKKNPVVTAPGGINGNRKLGVPKKFATSTYD